MDGYKILTYVDSKFANIILRYKYIVSFYVFLWHLRKFVIFSESFLTSHCP